MLDTQEVEYYEKIITTLQEIRKEIKKLNKKMEEQDND